MGRMGIEIDWDFGGGRETNQPPAPPRQEAAGKQQGWRRGLWRRGVVRPRRTTPDAGFASPGQAGVIQGAAWSWWAGPYRISTDGCIAEVSVGLWT